MPEICILPAEIVNRIAAGEVVERPASLVKELVENSIDADATEIEIDLEDGGKKRVTVRDNGCGMSAKDLPLAFHSHATSKLSADGVDDLFRVLTLGFRGEALASIGAVADVEVVSRPPLVEHAYRYRPNRGKPEPAAGRAGTVIEVRDIFCNVPARRKFLRSTSTELSHVLQQVTRLALGFPGVHFRLTHSGRKVLDLRQVSSLRERVVEFVGHQKADQLLEVSEVSEVAVSGGGGPSLRGFVGSPELRRKDNREQHFFVNGRWVRDRMISHALRSAFQGYLIPGWQPVAYLFLELPPESVDINVHPTKSEVRFRDSASIYPLVFHALRRALEGEGDEGDGGATHGDPRESGEVSAENGGGDPTDSSAAFTERGRVEQAALDFFAAERSSPKGGHPSFSSFPSRSGGAHGTEGPAGSVPAAEGSGVHPARRTAESFRAFQILDSFLVVEDDDGVRFIDQHALHEKILFEEIYEKLLTGQVLQQKLLVPEVIELPLEHMPLVDRARDFLAPCGYAIEAFGDREVAVHGVPRLFDRVKGRDGVREFLQEVFSWLGEDGSEFADPSPRDERGALSRPYRRLASILACKKAVKAGMRLHRDEIESLLRKADLADDPRHCPHGRSTTVRISRSQLERKFDRK